MTRWPVGAHSASAALLALIVLPLTASHATAGPINTLIDTCVSQLDAQTDVGYARIAARCPELVRQLRASDWAAWLPGRWQDPNNDLSADGLRNLQQLASYESALGVRPSKLDIQLLPAALARLPHADSTRWSRIRRSVRAWFESRPVPSENSWWSDFLVRLRTGTSGLDGLVYAALTASLLLAAFTGVREWRHARGSKPSASSDSTMPAAATPVPVELCPAPAGGLSWMDRPRELLDLVLAQLVERRALPPSGALTVRELTQLARLPDTELAHLARLAVTAESLRFAAVPPERSAVERSVAEGESLLQQLSGSDGPSANGALGGRPS